VTGAMSRDPSTVARVVEIEAAAADWIATQRDSGAWTDEDQAALDAWLEESTAHEVAYLRLEAAWSRADRLVALNRALSRPGSEVLRGRLRLILRAAAGLIAISVVAVGAVQYDSRPDLQTFATPVGGREKITLLDGSQIELNTDTRLRADFKTGNNTVWLDKGEAYFEIKHNPARQFIVMASGHRITDLGTKFRLRSRPGRLEVALLDGQLSIESTNLTGQTKPTVLKPGDVATTNSDSVFVTRKDKQKLANELGWRRGVVILENATLAEAASELNRYNSKQLVIADPVTARRRIAGTFRTNDLDDFTELAQEVLKLHVTNGADAVVISR
jgi:transmembrane sensor